MDLEDDFFQLQEACICPAFKAARSNYTFTYNQIAGNCQENCDILILAEHKELPEMESRFRQMCNIFFKDKKYAIINALGCTPQDFTAPGTIANYIKCKHYNIAPLIKRFNPKVIVTTGRAIYTVTEEKAIQPNRFFSIYEDDRWFWSPEHQCKVFPVPALYQWINLDNYEHKFSLTQLRKAANSLLDKRTRTPKLNCLKVEEPNAWLRQVIDDPSIEWIACDTETTGLNYHSDVLYNLSMSYDGINGYFLLFADIDKSLLIELFEKKKTIWHNFQFDGRFLKKNGIENVKCHFDTLLASYACNENMSHGLKFLTWMHTKFGGYEKKLKGFMKEHTVENFAAIPEPILLEYACMDAILTFQLFRYFELRLKNEPEVENYYYTCLIFATNTLFEIEMNGIPIDKDYLFWYNDHLNSRLREIDGHLFEQFGEVINYRSTAQLSRLLRLDPNFEVLKDEKGVPMIGKSGSLLLNKTTLPMYATQGSKVAEFLLERNHLTKEISQLGVELLKMQKISGNDLFADIETEEEQIDEDDIETSTKGLTSSILDWRLYGNFLLFGTETGRMSSSGGLRGKVNLQNMPKKEDFRKIFKPRPNYTFMEYDYASMEIRQASQISGPGPLEQVILKGLDPHSYTGVNVYKIQTGKTITYEEFHRKAKKEEIPEFAELRGKSKTVNFQYIYGASEYGLSASLQIPVEEAKEILEAFQNTYPEFKEYVDTYRDHAKEHGYVDNMFGKRRRIPELTYIGQNSKVSNALNSAINSPIQGLSGITSYLAMCNIHLEFKTKKMKSLVLCNVHDSILFEIALDEKEAAKKIIEHFMTTPYYENYNGNEVGLTVEAKEGQVWGFNK